MKTGKLAPAFIKCTEALKFTLCYKTALSSVSFMVQTSLSCFITSAAKFRFFPPLVFSKGERDKMKFNCCSGHVRSRHGKAEKSEPPTFRLKCRILGIFNLNNDVMMKFDNNVFNEAMEANKIVRYHRHFREVVRSYVELYNAYYPEVKNGEIRKSGYICRYCGSSDIWEHEQFTNCNNCGKSYI